MFDKSIKFSMKLQCLIGKRELLHVKKKTKDNLSLYLISIFPSAVLVDDFILMTLSLFFKCRIFLQPVMGSIWDLHGVQVISLPMRPFTWHQVLKDQAAPSSMRSEKMRTYIPPFYANSSMSHITSLLACRQLERTSPARTRKPNLSALVKTIDL